MTSGSVLAGGREPHSAFPSLDYICPNSTGRDRVSPLPEELRSLEPRVREQIGTHLARGKVDGTLRFQPGEAAAGAIEMNAEQVQRLLAASDHLRGLAPDVPSLRAIDILRWPGVIKVPPLEVESLGAAALEALNATLDDLVKTRQREGARMQEFMLARLQSMDEEVAKAKVLFPEAGPVGRRLDFLMQELNREANTLSSKSTDTRLTNVAVELKVLIEQMREQVQNIE